MGDVGVESSGKRVGKEVGRGPLSFGRTPDPESFSVERLYAAEKAAEQVLNSIHSTLDSEETRRDVIDHLQRLFKTKLDCEVVPYGSVPLKTYLPDGDIDLTVLKSPVADESLARDVLAILRGEEQNAYAEYQIHDTQFIDAEVKIVKCLVKNIVIDISFNQIGGLSTLCFLEQVDRLVGKNHLFKRSILLIKTWCFYESRILGATHGLISTYGLETLILYIFQLFHSSLTGPVATLYRFLDYFSHFDWDNYCISLKGPVCISSLPCIVVKFPDGGSNNLLLDADFMETFQVPYRWLQPNQKAFQLKHMNIIDPLKENNNLGRSVRKGNFFRIRSAFQFGARKLGRVLSLSGDQVADEVNKFFSNTLSRHQKRSNGSIEHLTPGFGGYSSSIASLSSHVESISENDLLLNYSSAMGEKPVFLLENKPDRCFARNDHPDTASGNLCHELNCFSPKPTAKTVDEEDGSDFRGESEALDPLADLSGDYDSHIRSFLYGQLSHRFPSSAPTPTPAPAPSNHWARPSSISNNIQYEPVYQNTVRYDSISVHHSIPFNQNHILSMPPTMYSVPNTACPIGAFLYQENPSARGTGTYFPPTLTNGFHIKTPSQGRGRRKEPGNRNQFHHYQRSSNVYPAFNRSISSEKNSRGVLPPHDKFQGGASQSAFSSGEGNRAKSCANSKSKPEFGSLGNMGEEVIASSKHVRCSNQYGLTGNTGFNRNTEAKEVCKAVDAP